MATILDSNFRYFSGGDDEKQHIYNFWHGVLADFFEGVHDMDRKAEVVPVEVFSYLNYWPISRQCFISVTPENIRKRQKRLKFSGGMEIKHWREMGECSNS